jgi:hypothetical protein
VGIGRKFSRHFKWREEPISRTQIDQKRHTMTMIRTAPPMFLLRRGTSVAVATQHRIVPPTTTIGISTATLARYSSRHYLNLTSWVGGINNKSSSSSSKPISSCHPNIISPQFFGRTRHYPQLFFHASQQHSDVIRIYYSSQGGGPNNDNNNTPRNRLVSSLGMIGAGGMLLLGKGKYLVGALKLTKFASLGSMLLTVGAYTAFCE